MDAGYSDITESITSSRSASRSSAGVMPSASMRRTSRRTSRIPVRRADAPRLSLFVGFLRGTGEVTIASFWARQGMASQASVTVSIQFTPPSAPVGSGSAVFQVTASHNAQNVGQIDVNPADTPATIFPVAFGSVAKAKILVVKNLMSSEIGVRINGAVADTFQLAAGGEFCYVCSAFPATTPVTSVSVVTTASPAAVELIQYWVFGD